MDFVITGQQTGCDVRYSFGLFVIPIFTQCIKGHIIFERRVSNNKCRCARALTNVQLRRFEILGFSFSSWS